MQSFITEQGSNDVEPSYVWLSHKYDVLYDQVSAGLESINIFNRYIKNVSSTLVATDVDKLIKGKNITKEEDRCKIFASTCKSLSLVTYDIVKAEINFSINIRDHITESLKVFYKENKDLKNKIDSEYKKLFNNLRNAESGLNKSKESALKQLEKVKTIQNQPPPESAKPNEKKKYEKTKEHALEACKNKFVAYETKYKLTRDQTIKFYSQQYPQKILALEKLERLRLHTMSEKLATFMKIIETYVNELTHCKNQANSFFNQLDKKDQFNEYVKELMNEYGTAPPIFDIPFGLPCKSEDLDNWKFDTWTAGTVCKNLTEDYKDFSPCTYTVPTFDFPSCQTYDGNDVKNQVRSTRDDRKISVFNKFSSKRSSNQSTNSAMRFNQGESKFTPEKPKLTKKSTVADVETWLKANNFDHLLLADKDGEYMLTITKNECKKIYGISNGIRLSNRLAVYTDS